MQVNQDVNTVSVVSQLWLQYCVCVCFSGSARNSLNQPSFWLSVLLTSILCVLPVVTYRFLSIRLCPSVNEKVQSKCLNTQTRAHTHTYNRHMLFLLSLFVQTYRWCARWDRPKQRLLLHRDAGRSAAPAPGAQATPSRTHRATETWWHRAGSCGVPPCLELRDSPTSVVPRRDSAPWDGPLDTAPQGASKTPKHQTWRWHLCRCTGVLQITPFDLETETGDENLTKTKCLRDCNRAEVYPLSRPRAGDFMVSPLCRSWLYETCIWMSGWQKSEWFRGSLCLQTTQMFWAGSPNLCTGDITKSANLQKPVFIFFNSILISCWKLH